MKIGIDIMGGDRAPEASVEGALMALKELAPTDTIVLFGDQEIIIKTLIDQGGNPSDFEIVDSSQVILMGEHPTKAFSQKPESSIVKGFKLLKAKAIDSFCSAGNTGAMLVGSVYTLNPIPGIIRPCTATPVPRQDGSNGLLLDVGTNPDVKPDVLYQFAVLGSLYAKHVLNIHNPRVGLLNIGEEDEKGNILSQTAFRMMKGSTDFNFIGNVEGRDILGTKADVIVCDGFTGNIMLKQLESVYRILVKRNLVDDYFARFNYELTGGTPILGVNSTVLVGHGISSPLAFKNMILMSKEVAEAKLTKKIKKALLNEQQKFTN